MSTSIYLWIINLFIWKTEFILSVNNNLGFSSDGFTNFIIYNIIFSIFNKYFFNYINILIIYYKSVYENILFLNIIYLKHKYLFNYLLLFENILFFNAKMIKI